METKDAVLFRKWMEKWEDLIEFEVIAVVTSEEAKKTILQLL